MTQDIRISFSELKSIATRVISLVGSVSGVETNEISIKTAINDDLGVDGDDWGDLLQALNGKEQVDLSNLHFYDYFRDEGQISYDGIYFVLFFPARLILHLLTLRWKYQPFNTFATMSGPDKEPLTVGDIITSTVEGRFVKRQSRRFVNTDSAVRA